MGNSPSNSTIENTIGGISVIFFWLAAFFLTIGNYLVASPLNTLTALVINNKIQLPPLPYSLPFVLDTPVVASGVPMEVNATTRHLTFTLHFLLA